MGDDQRGNADSDFYYSGNFYFGPKSILLYGAASFLYELFPTAGGPPDLPTISSFFGASSDGKGGFTFNGQEKIPDDWYNRKLPFGNVGVSVEIVAQYLKYPVLFGGNTGKGNFNALNFGAITNGKWDATTKGALCLLYQIATDNVPGSLSGVSALPLEVVSWAAGKLNPVSDTWC